MTFKDLHPNRRLTQIKEFAYFLSSLITDKRLRLQIAFIGVSLVLIGVSCGLYIFQTNHISSLKLTLHTQTQEILRRIAVKQQQANIPQFEASMQSMGAYLKPLTVDSCLSNVTYCFLQKNKPHIDITLLKQEIEPTYTVQSFNITFKSSFDYEIFDMLEYIFSTPKKFGYTRLREFEIEQLFESAPIVKGNVIYDQMSLTP